MYSKPSFITITIPFEVSESILVRSPFFFILNYSKTTKTYLNECNNFSIKNQNSFGISFKYN